MQFKKIWILAFLLTTAALTLYYANTLIKRAQSLEVAASAGSAQIFFQPDSTTLAPTAPMNLWATTDKPLAFARIEFTFDPTKVGLTSEITLAQSSLQRVIKTTTMTEANSSGKVVLILGLDPTTLTSAPTGTFKLASFNLVAKVTTANLTTSLTPLISNLQLVDTSTIPFVTTATAAQLTLNPQSINPSPSPSPTPTPTPAKRGKGKR